MMSAIEILQQLSANQPIRISDNYSDSDPDHRHSDVLRAVIKRLREELGKLRVAVNEEKSRIVDLRKGESFSFLGFEFRLVRSVRGLWRPQYTPKLDGCSRQTRSVAQVHSSGILPLGWIQKLDIITVGVGPALLGGKSLPT